MAEFKILQENGQDIYPITHPDAVRDENGKSVKSELTELQSKVGEFKVKDASVSGNTLNITKSDGSVLPFTPQGNLPLSVVNGKLCITFNA